MTRAHFTFVALALSGAVALAPASRAADSGSASSGASQASPTAENPSGGAATTGMNPNGNPNGEPRVVAPSTRTMTTGPDGTRRPASSAVDSQIGPGTSSGDMNGTSQTSSERPNR